MTFQSLVNHYNFYWLATLFGSALAIAILVAIIPASFNRRPHSGMLVINECLSACQLGIMTYYIAIFLEGDFSDSSRAAPVFISGLLALTFGFVVVSAKWASPTAQDQCLQSDHSCPKETPEKCAARLKARTKWRLCGANLTLFGVSLIPALLVPFFLKPVNIKSYSGEWSGHIDWNAAWATRLLNYNGHARLALANPRSEGTVYIYKNSKGDYGSVSLWHLKNGPDVYADLAVVGEAFQIDGEGRIRRFDMRTAFRNQVRKYEYAPFYHYYFQFDAASETLLNGKMMAYSENQEPIEAGKVTLQLK